jgi:hypothetical protein
MKCSSETLGRQHDSWARDDEFVTAGIDGSALQTRRSSSICARFSDSP